MDKLKYVSIYKKNIYHAKCLAFIFNATDKDIKEKSFKNCFFCDSSSDVVRTFKLQCFGIWDLSPYIMCYDSYLDILSFKNKILLMYQFLIYLPMDIIRLVIANILEASKSDNSSCILKKLHKKYEWDLHYISSDDYRRLKIHILRHIMDERKLRGNTGDLGLTVNQVKHKYVEMIKEDLEKYKLQYLQ